MARDDETRSYLIAGALVVMFLVSAAVLISRRDAASSSGRRDNNERVAPGDRLPREAPVRHDSARPPKLTVVQLREIRANARRRYASQLAQRFRQHAFAATVGARGPDAKTLEFSWKEQNFDSLHMERLKKSASQRKELRQLGFRRVVLRVGDRVLWQTTLD